MSKPSSLPPIISQMIESFKSPITPETVKFNLMLTLENIRDCCDVVIKDYNKKSLNKKK